MLAVGGAEPRKNLGLVVDAWRALSAEARGDAVLALGGSAFRGAGILDGVDDAAEHGIRDLGRIPDDDLAPLYGGATIFCYPSIAEGFGLPPVEAMACGTAVIAADATSIPEATGDGAMLVEPRAEPFTRAIEMLLGDPSAVDELVARGLARAAQVTWDRAARGVMEILTDER